jgi:hypothetical protein
VTRHFDVACAVDELRQLIAKADALAHAAEDLFEGIAWLDGDDRRRLERLAHLVGATVEAVQAAMDAGAEIASELSAQRPRA